MAINDRKTWLKVDEYRDAVAVAAAIDTSRWQQNTFSLEVPSSTGHGRSKGTSVVTRFYVLTVGLVVPQDYRNWIESIHLDVYTFSSVFSPFWSIHIVTHMNFNNLNSDGKIIDSRESSRHCRWLVFANILREGVGCRIRRVAIKLPSFNTRWAPYAFVLLILSLTGRLLRNPQQGRMCVCLCVVRLKEEKNSHWTVHCSLGDWSNCLIVANDTIQSFSNQLSFVFVSHLEHVPSLIETRNVGIFTSLNIFHSHKA